MISTKYDLPHTPTEENLAYQIVHIRKLSSRICRACAFVCLLMFIGSFFLSPLSADMSHTHIAIIVFRLIALVVGLYLWFESGEFERHISHIKLHYPSENK